MPAAADADAFPRPFGDKYVLLRHLATGGMADVFLAHQRGPGGFVKECVIKRILPHLARDQQFITMFLDEARLAARLNHPNLAHVYDLGQVGSDYFIAMEFVEGVDLEQIIALAHQRGDGRVPVDIAARIVASVADGLEHAHHATDSKGGALKIVHRDVTPQNIVVSFEGVPKLLDFGIAKATGRQGRTEVGVVKGKAPYMSPEQIEGREVDGRSDLFSLGAILYELTCGHPPFLGDNAAQVGIKILHDDPTPPSLLVESYPEAVEAILAAALAKRPDDRIPTARALQVQLERYLQSSAVVVGGAELAHYLAERFPRAPRPVLLYPAGDPRNNSSSSLPPPPGYAEHSMYERPNRPTHQLEIGDGISLIGEAPESRRKLGGGGGGGWIVGVIIALVALTGAGLYFLRGYETRKEARQEVAAPTAPTPAAARPAPPETVKPSPVVAPPAPVKPPEPKVVEPAAPVPEPAPAPVRLEARPEKRPARPHHPHVERPVQLPHLPSPPPPTE